MFDSAEERSASASRSTISAPAIRRSAICSKAPFDKIKIDQSFVRGAAIAGNRNAAIIKAIVTLADTLGMETTAEGVEVQDEIALIRELGCSHIQGYRLRPADGRAPRRQPAAREAGGQASALGPQGQPRAAHQDAPLGDRSKSAGVQRQRPDPQHLARPAR